MVQTSGFLPASASVACAVPTCTMTAGMPIAAHVAAASSLAATPPVTSCAAVAVSGASMIVPDRSTISRGISVAPCIRWWERRAMSHHEACYGGRSIDAAYRLAWWAIVHASNVGQKYDAFGT